MPEPKPINSRKDYELSVMERFALLGILPGEGDIVTLRIIQELRMALAPTEEESEELKLQVNGSQIQWDQSAARPKTVQIGPQALRTIVALLEKLNAEKKLTMQHLPLYERFVE